MNPNKFSDRTLAVGLLFLALLSFSLLIVMPVTQQFLELQETKNQLVFRLEKYQRVLAKKDAILNAKEELVSQYEQQGYLNTQKTGALASAELQEMIKQIIVESGGQLSSTQGVASPELPEAEQQFERIAISVRMSASSDVLRAILYKIETATPLIVIDQIDMRPMRGVRNKITRQIDPSNQLNITFQAMMFMKKMPNAENHASE